MVREKSAQMFPLHLQTTKRALNPFNSLCLSFTSQSLKYLHEKTKSFDGEYIDETTNKKLPEGDFAVVAVVGGKKEYVHGGEFHHFILLALTFSPLFSSSPSLPFHWEPRFQRTCPTEGYKARISEAELSAALSLHKYFGPTN